jgi:hypothetical protein
MFTICLKSFNKFSQSTQSILPDNKPSPPRPFIVVEQKQVHSTPAKYITITTQGKNLQPKQVTHLQSRSVSRPTTPTSQGNNFTILNRTVTKNPLQQQQSFSPPKYTIVRTTRASNSNQTVSYINEEGFDDVISIASDSLPTVGSLIGTSSPQIKRKFNQTSSSKTSPEEKVLICSDSPANFASQTKPATENGKKIEIIGNALINPPTNVTKVQSTSVVNLANGKSMPTAQVQREASGRPNAQELRISKLEDENAKLKTEVARLKKTVANIEARLQHQ